MRTAINPELAQWVPGVCSKCEARDYVIMMRSTRRLCLICFGRTGEKMRVNLLYAPGTEPPLFKKRPE